MQLRFEEGKQLTCSVEDILSNLAQEHGYMPHTMRHRPCKCAVTGLTSDAEAERQHASCVADGQLPRACQLPRAWIVPQRKRHAACGGGGSSSCRPPAESNAPPQARRSRRRRAQAAGTRRRSRVAGAPERTARPSDQRRERSLRVVRAVRAGWVTSCRPATTLGCVRA
eukprot:scaffold33859_cov64-Phaeocystis_antarctica.AAC.2